MGIFVRNPNPLRALDELPDKPRLGVNLIIAGVALLAVRSFWMRVAPVSFQKASAIFFHFSQYLSRHSSQEDLSIYLLIFGLGSIVAGTFIFFRRGVWWWQDKRDQEDIIHLRFK